MFNLEQEIKRWLRLFGKHRAFNHGAIREMELHLRDHIDDLIAEGYTEEEAFGKAVKEFGEIPAMAEEEFRNLKRNTTLRPVLYSALIKSFYFVGIRNLLKYRNYFLLNISGLAIGLTCFILISLYILNELSYDRFHDNFENIYRVNFLSTTSGLSTDYATASSPLARMALAIYPEVVNATRIIRNGSLLVGIGNDMYSEEGILFADSTFFEVFDFKFLKGNLRTALVEPRSMVLTGSFAEKYFGEEDPMGKFVSLEEDSVFYVVTGVVEDVPVNSHIQFDILCTTTGNDWWNNDQWIGPPGFHTYLVLRDHTDVKAQEKKMQDLVYKYMAPEIEHYTGMSMSDWEKAGNYTGFYLIPLKNIHLHSTSTKELEPAGNISYIRIYALIGLSILFVAIFNFINLATSQSASRSKEVGVRKVMGSARTGLIYQFLVESTILSVLATILAVILVLFLKPFFAGLTGREIPFGILFSIPGIFSLFCLAIVTGILAGCYPAFILASFQPIAVINGTFNANARSGWIRSSLIVLQFAVSIVMIIVTMVVYSQIDFMLSKNLGFDKDQILVIHRSDLLKNGLGAFKNELNRNPDIREIAYSETLPGKQYSVRSYRPKDNHETFLFNFNQVSFNYDKMLDLKLVKGRFFSEEHRADSNAVVINETAAKALGAGDPVGQQLTSPWHMGELLTVIGVVGDYNIESLHKSIEPVVLEPAQGNPAGYVTVKIGRSENIRQTIGYIQDIWNLHTNDKPFEHFFFDEDYENLYRSEFTTGKVFIVFSALSVFIAGLGLIGLLTFSISIRRKEIGIRKILGAGTGKLLNLLSGDAGKLMVIATLIAWPGAFFISDYWLHDFAQRIPVNPWWFVASIIIVLFICVLAVSFQLLRAVNSNPVNAIRRD